MHNCKLTVASLNNIIFSSANVGKCALYSPTLITIADYFSNLNLLNGFEFAISNAFILGIVVSNDECIYNPCKELLPMDLIMLLSQKYCQYDNICVYLNMIACIIPDIQLEVIEEELSDHISHAAS